jgi:hypothetical protein
MAERDDGRKNPGTPGRMPENADRDAQVDAPRGGIGAGSGKADPAAEGRGLGTGGAPIPDIGEPKTDAAAGPGTPGTVLPGNMTRRDRPDATET